MDLAATTAAVAMVVATAFILMAGTEDQPAVRHQEMHAGIIKRYFASDAQGLDIPIDRIGQASGERPRDVATRTLMRTDKGWKCTGKTARRTTPEK